MSKNFFFLVLGILLVFGGLYSAVWMQLCPLRHAHMDDLQEEADLEELSKLAEDLWEKHLEKMREYLKKSK